MKRIFDTYEIERWMNSIHGSKYFTVSRDGFREECRFSNHFSNGEFDLDFDDTDEFAFCGNGIYYRIECFEFISTTLKINQTTLISAASECEEFKFDLDEMYELWERRSQKRD